MNLSDHYDAMRQAAFRQFRHQGAVLDPLLDSATDTRRGLTLLSRPPAPILAAVAAIQADFQRTEPAQYYYPASDIHLTILSIISCYSGFRLESIDPLAYQDAIRALLREVRSFSIEVRGLTASASGIMVQGFPDDRSLEHLRDGLRAYFQQSSLAQSIDQRYRLQTAHATIIRFKSALADPARLIDTITRYQNHSLGTFEVNTVELVCNDWYQRANQTILLEKFILN